MYEFETGPIRPPSEAYSILLRVTRNCPWNQCAFCPVYKGEKFSLRTVDEVKKDIDSIYELSAIISEKVISSGHGKITQSIFSRLIDEGLPPYHLQQVIFWMHYGMTSLFLQDADAMVMRSSDLAEIIRYAKSKIPSIERITCYSRSKTLVVKKPEELRELKEAGLNRIHIGMESGADSVLKLIKKGVKAEEHIMAGKKVVEAGFELSEYFMPGLGGKSLSQEHAIETARVLNEINPSFIRIRTTTPVPGTELYKMMEEGSWIPLSEVEKVEETKLMISSLNGISSYIQSDHVMNLIEDANGKLPEEREYILSHFDKFLSMEPLDQECFISARRTGSIRFLSDYKRTQNFINLREKLISLYGSVENAALNLSSSTL